MDTDNAIVMVSGFALGVAFMSGWLAFFITLGIVGGIPLLLIGYAGYRDWKFHRDYARREGLRRAGLGGS